MSTSDGIDSVIDGLVAIKGDADQRIFDKTREYLMRNVATLPEDEDLADLLQMCLGYGYFDGYVDGLDYEITSRVILDSEPSRMPELQDFAKRNADRLPRTTIDHICDYVQQMADAINGMIDGMTLPSSVLVSLADSYADGLVDGRSDYQQGRFPQSDEVRLAVANLTAMHFLSFWVPSIEDAIEQSATITSTVIDERTGVEHVIEAPREMFEHGEFSYDSGTGRCTYTWDADDGPDFTADNDVERTHIVDAGIRVTERVLGISMGEEDPQYPRSVLDGEIDGYLSHASDNDDSLESDIGSCIIMLERLLPRLHDFISDSVIPPSGVGREWLEDYERDAPQNYVNGYLAGIDAYQDDCVNEHDDDLPYDAPTSDNASTLYGEIIEYCYQHKLKRWIGVAAFDFVVSNTDSIGDPGVLYVAYGFMDGVTSEVSAERGNEVVRDEHPMMV